MLLIWCLLFLIFITSSFWFVAVLWAFFVYWWNKWTMTCFVWCNFIGSFPFEPSLPPFILAVFTFLRTGYPVQNLESPWPDLSGMVLYPSSADTWQLWQTLLVTSAHPKNLEIRALITSSAFMFFWALNISWVVVCGGSWQAENRNSPG